MQVTTIAEARALVGRTFDRDGERRTVTAVDVIQCRHGVSGSVKWRAAGPWTRLFRFNDWLSQATEVTE